MIKNTIQLRHTKKLLFFWLIVNICSSCTRKQESANTQEFVQNPPTNYPLNTLSACADPRISFTMVDDWTLRHVPSWSNDVLLLLQNTNDPKSLYFRHPKDNLAYLDFVTDNSCVDLDKDGSRLNTVFPVLAGANLLSQNSPPCPGGTPSQDQYQYVFTSRNGRKYLALGRGNDGCEIAGSDSNGGCFVIGSVERDQVIPSPGICLAGYKIYNRVRGLKSKSICGKSDSYDQGGQMFPAGFLILKEPALNFAQKYGCQAPEQPAIQRRNPVNQASGTFPLPLPTVYGPLPLPTVSPFPVTEIPTPNCNPWLKNSCYDGWSQQGNNPTEAHVAQDYPKIIQKKGKIISVSPEVWSDSRHQESNQSNVIQYIAPTPDSQKPLWHKGGIKN